MSDNDISYGVHPSERLIRLFTEKPYQGASPEKSKVIIVGNDANYSPAISEHAFFENILEYHTDGVAFWKERGVHHPFLLRDYPFDRRKGGVRYHSNFAKLGFGSEHASSFSFVELLDVPTIGNTGSDPKLFFELLNPSHLNWLEEMIFGGSQKLVLVNQTLARSIQKINKELAVLGKLASLMADSTAPSIAFEDSKVMIYNGYSFSHAVTDRYLEEVAELIEPFAPKVVSAHLSIQRAKLEMARRRKQQEQRPKQELEALQRAEKMRIRQIGLRKSKTGQKETRRRERSQTGKSQWGRLPGYGGTATHRVYVLYCKTVNSTKVGITSLSASERRDKRFCEWPGGPEEWQVILETDRMPEQMALRIENRVITALNSYAGKPWQGREMFFCDSGLAVGQVVKALGKLWPEYRTAICPKGY